MLDFQVPNIFIGFGTLFKNFYCYLLLGLLGIAADKIHETFLFNHL